MSYRGKAVEALGNHLTLQTIEDVAEQCGVRRYFFFAKI